MRRRTPAVVVCWLVVSGSVTGVTVAAQPQVYSPSNCAANSLYILLRLCGSRASLASVEAALPLHSDHGPSMADLQSAARVCGLRLSGVQLQSRDIPLDRPVIAYVTRGAGGHFLVLRPVGVTGTLVQILDFPDPPLTVDYERILHGPGWTGRLLVPEPLLERLVAYCWPVAIFLPAAFLSPRVRRTAHAAWARSAAVTWRVVRRSGAERAFQDGTR